MSDTWKKALIGPGDPIREAMEGMGKSRQHVVMVVDGDGKLLGTVTDGDIRRAILRSLPLEEPIGKIMNREPFTALAGDGAEARLADMQDHVRPVQHHALVPGGGGLGVVSAHAHGALDVAAAPLQRPVVTPHGDPVKAGPHVLLVEEGPDLEVPPQDLR